MNKADLFWTLIRSEKDEKADLFWTLIRSVLGIGYCVLGIESLVLGIGAGGITPAAGGTHKNPLGNPVGYLVRE